MPVTPRPTTPLRFHHQPNTSANIGLNIDFNIDPNAGSNTDSHSNWAFGVDVEPEAGPSPTIGHVKFMNKYWPNGQAGWAKQPFIQTFPPSKRIVNQLHSITVLCLYFEIDLQSLYEPDGYIYNAVKPGSSLGQTNCGRALERIKKAKGFEGPVHRSILHGEQDGRFDNDFDPKDAAEAEQSDDLPTIDNMAPEAKFKRPLKSPSITGSIKRQRSEITTSARGSSAAESFDLTQEDSDHDSQSAASHLHPIEDEDSAKQKLSDPTAWLCDESIDRSVRQSLLYQNPSNFAWRDPLWLDVQGVNDEGKTLRGEFPKDSRIVFV
ncbi:hypothetical protein BFJ68_g18429, partial [Fusarium oxysporum]